MLSLTEFSNHLTGLEDKRSVLFQRIKSLLQEYPCIFILGATSTAVHITELLREKCGATNFRYVVDDAYMDAPSVIPKPEIIPFSQYMGEYSQNSILVIGYYSYLAEMQFRSKFEGRLKHLFSFQYAWLSDKPIYWCRKDVEENTQAFYETYCMLEDEVSRETLLQYIRASLTGSLSELFQYRCDGQYFNSLLDGLEFRTYIDCGAYDGDTVHAFLAYAETYRRIIAFEPDKQNLERLYERINTEGIKNIEVVEAGVYHKNGTLHFSDESSDASSRHFSESVESGDQLIVRTIDSLNVQDVSLIKMDIEGSEMSALRGARRTIREQTPALAICVYHKPEDLITIPQYIHNMEIGGGGGYHYFLRHHGNNLTELVLYAIPTVR